MLWTSKTFRSLTLKRKYFENENKTQPVEGKTSQGLLKPSMDTVSFCIKCIVYKRTDWTSFLCRNSICSYMYLCCSEGGRNSKCRRAMLVHNPIYNRLSKRRHHTVCPYWQKSKRVSKAFGEFWKRIRAHKECFTFKYLNHENYFPIYWTKENKSCVIQNLYHL